MNLLQVREQLEQLHKLIERRGTGTPAELAQRLGVTDRTVKRYIAQLRELGADIRFCLQLNSYYYVTPVTFRFGFEPVFDNEDTTIESGEKGGGKYHNISKIATVWLRLEKKSLFSLCAIS